MYIDICTSQQQLQVTCGSRKKVAPYFTSVLLYFTGSSGSLSPELLSAENCVPLNPVLAGVRDFAPFSLSLMYRLYQTESAIFI
jgi:hypothetical protein